MRMLLVFALLLMLVGCGYHFPGQGGALPGNVRLLHIPLFANRTAKPQLENRLSNRVSEVFARNGNITLVEQRSQADAVLEAAISSYAAVPLSYNQNDVISEYRATMTVEAKLRQVEDGRLLWSGTSSWYENYEAVADKGRQYDLENDAITEINLRLSEELLYRLLDDF